MPREVSVRKEDIFRHGKEIKGLRGGIHRYAAQENPEIDTASAEKGTFRMETISQWTSAKRLLRKTPCR